MSKNKLIKHIEKNAYGISIVAIVLLLVIFLVSISFSFSINKVLSGKIQEAKENAIPSKLQLSVIDCDGCSDVSFIVEAIKKQNVEITNEEKLSSNDARAKELISKYNIQKLPSVLVFGEIDNGKVSFDNFDENDDAMVLSTIAPPYLDTAQNRLKGVVFIIELVDSSCTECSNLDSVLASFVEAGIVIGNKETLEYNSDEGEDLINEYGLIQAPAMLFSEDIEEYEGMKEIFAQLDSVNKKGFYAIHSLMPPYRNLTTGKIDGIVDLIMLTDNSCTNCYDVTVNKQILQGLGLVLDNENTYDVSSTKGKQLISQYDIKKVPTILVSSEASIYGSFVQAWKAVGDVHSDGWFIMRKPENMGDVVSTT